MIRKNLNEYNCFFSIIIRQKSKDGIDLEEHRMDEMCKDINKMLVEKYPSLGVFAGGFEKA
jgi:hypothetical protein